MSSLASTKPTTAVMPFVARDDFVERGQVVVDEGAAQDEVFGRVAGDGQLRERDDVGAEIAGAADPVDDLRGVAGQIADGGVDLRQGDAQRAHAAAFRT